MPRSELTKRWLVALVGLPTVGVLVWIGRWALGPVLALLCAGAALEVYRLAEVHDVRALRWAGTAGAAGLVLLAAAYPGVAVIGPVAWTFIVAFLLVLLALAIVQRGVDGRPLLSVAVTALGALVPALAMSHLIFVRHLPVTAPVMAPETWPALAGVALVAYPLMVTWLTDTFAFFGGRRWGDHKLAPVLSPGKTREGAVLGLLGGALGGWLVGFVALNVGLGVPISGLAGAGGGLWISVVSQTGDLVESAWKREAGVKDSGTLFPGHGGILDRMDALLFSVPASYWWLAVVLPGVAPW